MAKVYSESSGKRKNTTKQTRPMPKAHRGRAAGSYVDLRNKRVIVRGK